MQPDSATVRDLLVAKFEALLDECDLIPSNPQTVDNMDEFFLLKGRKLLQETFEAKLQERIQQAEVDIEPPPCPTCKKNDLSRQENKNNNLRPRFPYPPPSLLLLLSLQETLLSYRRNSWIRKGLYKDSEAFHCPMLRSRCVSCRRRQSA